MVFKICLQSYFYALVVFPFSKLFQKPFLWLPWMCSTAYNRKCENEKPQSYFYYKQLTNKRGNLPKFLVYLIFSNMKSVIFSWFWPGWQYQIIIKLWKLFKYNQRSKRKQVSAIPTASSQAWVMELSLIVMIALVWCLMSGLATDLQTFCKLTKSFQTLLFQQR